MDKTTHNLDTTGERHGDSLFELLTARELTAVRLVFDDFTSQEIASKLNLSVETVKKHRKNIIAKSGFSEKTAFRKIFRLLNSLFKVEKI